MKLIDDEIKEQRDTNKISSKWKTTTINSNNDLYYWTNSAEQQLTRLLSRQIANEIGASLLSNVIYAPYIPMTTTTTIGNY